MPDNKREVTISAPSLPHFAVLREGERLIVGLGSSREGESFLALSIQGETIKAVQIEVNRYNGGVKMQARESFSFDS